MTRSLVFTYSHPGLTLFHLVLDSIFEREHRLLVLYFMSLTPDIDNPLRWFQGTNMFFIKNFGELFP
jgi:hypothetical protein